MKRRAFIIALLLLPVSVEASTNKRFVFKIKSKGGSITGNIVVSAKNGTAATATVMKKYKGCTVLSMDEK